ncbi:hypothetical protein QEN19_003113 [Hanseniaspora menglaensis]
MGIPKFYRYIAQRWPSVQQEIESSDSIPAFDNLYLDMNSILHNCTRSESVDIKMTEEEVCQKIFSYIDHLFNIINPKSTFYMAIDGVAPRAKMNQQRARRFRSAQEAEELMQDSIENGTFVPSAHGDDVFDKNAITPGTEFMSKLTENLKYYIHMKVSTDSAWKNINVIFSGHEVPGEGEHKIMEYIRALRSTPGYDLNTRHCIYGLDADLIMLGLVTHEPYLSILREEVLFGKDANKASKLSLEQQKFYLIHISLVREYLKLEFDILIDDLKFEYDFERVLDDFIFALFVIGNDFLPHLPDLHLTSGAFDYILAGFKYTLKALDDYLTEDGVINFDRFAVWISFLAKLERSTFEKEDIDLEWFNKKIIELSMEKTEKREQSGKTLLVKNQKKVIGSLRKWMFKNAQTLITSDSVSNPPVFNLNENKIFINDQPETIELIKDFAYKLGYNLVHSQSNDSYSLKMFIEEQYANKEESKEEMEQRVKNTRQIFKNYDHSVIFDDNESLNDTKRAMEEKFDQWKSTYYKSKINFDSINSPEKVIDMAENYAEGLQWVLYYYYRGCPSWNWYYRYHYAPRISDLAKGFEDKFEFEIGQPVKPFQQLMSVLPERSKKLIPIPYRTLMTDEYSPIKDFYPDHVDYDMNGKKASWEAVVLIAFVDKERLLKALEPLDHLLTEEEQKRNSHGSDLIFIFNPQVDQIYKSPLSGLFKNLEHNHCVEQSFILENIPAELLRSGLIEGVKIGKDSFSSFPSLHYLSFNYDLKNNNTRVFNMPSKEASVVLSFDKKTDLAVDEDSIIHSYLGSTVFTRYPYVRSSKVVGIKTKEGRYVLQNGLPTLKQYKSTGDFVKEVRKITDDYKNKKAFIVKDIKYLFEVQPVKGIDRQANGCFNLIFEENTEPEVYPYQLVVKSVSSVDERFMEREAIPIDKEFPIGSTTIFLGDYAYGCEATVAGYNESMDKLKLKLDMSSNKDTHFKALQKVAKDDIQAIKYFPAFTVMKKFNLSGLTLARLLDRCLVNYKNQTLNFGFGIRNEARRTKALGFAKKTDGWFYSELTMSMLEEFKTSYGDIFNIIIKTINSTGKGKSVPDIYLDELAEKDPKFNEKLESLKSWMRRLKDNLVLVSLESDALSRKAVKIVEDYSIKNSSMPKQPESFKNLANVPVKAIFNPHDSLGLLRKQKFYLGDRVSYVQTHGKIPYLSKGTVIGYFSEGQNVNIQVVFDNEIVAGSTLGGRLLTHRAIILDRALLLNTTTRQFIYHSKASKTHVFDEKAAEEQKKQWKAKVNDMKKKQTKELLNVIKKDGIEVSKKLDDEISVPINSVAAANVLTSVYNEMITDELAIPEADVSKPLAAAKNKKSKNKNNKSNAKGDIKKKTAEKKSVAKKQQPKENSEKKPVAEKQQPNEKTE